MVVELDRLDKSSWIDNRRAGSMDRAGSMVVELARLVSYKSIQCVWSGVELD